MEGKRRAKREFALGVFEEEDLSCFAINFGEESSEFSREIEAKK